MTMNIREPIPNVSRMSIGRGRTPVRHNWEIDPLLALHREMNLLFDNAFRGFFRGPDVAPFGFDQASDWPNVEVTETDNDVKVTAELPGLDEKDVKVELSNNMLIIDGEKKSEMEDQNRWFSERYYGRSER